MKAMFAKQASSIGTKGKLGVPSSGGSTPKVEKAKMPKMPAGKTEKTPSLKPPKVTAPKAAKGHKEKEHKGPATGKLLSNVGKVGKHLAKAAVTATGQGQTSEAIETAAKGKH